MNQVSYLINERTHEIEAELIANVKITIKSNWILEHIIANKGIYLNENFKKNNHLTDKKITRLLPPSNHDIQYEALFANAFKECLFEDGLKQMGYYWRDKNIYDDMSAEQLKDEIQKIQHHVK